MHNRNNSYRTLAEKNHFSLLIDNFEHNLILIDDVMILSCLKKTATW